MGIIPRCFLLLVLLAPGLTAWAAAMEYRYAERGNTPKRDDYQIKLLRLALDKTVAASGPYSLIRVVDNYSPRRLRLELYEGTRINVYVAPWRTQQKDSPIERNIPIGIPVMGDLLGYRQLIVRRADLPKFSKISTEAELKRLVAGLGRDWVDVRILRHNGYRVEDGSSLHTLMPMLANKRFDYVPMSVTEVESLFDGNATLAPELAVVPGLVIQYPLPAIFYVSARQNELAIRLEKGLLLAKKDGSLDELLQRAFRTEIRAVKSSSVRGFVLENPLLPAAAIDQQRLLRR